MNLEERRKWLNQDVAFYALNANIKKKQGVREVLTSKSRFGVKSCCEEKGNIHCGMCSEFPCELLNQYAYDENQGDDGKRIVQCRYWKKECDNGCNWLDTYLRSFPCVIRDFKEEWQ